MCGCARVTTDGAGRPVRITGAPDGRSNERYYLGPDCEGPIKTEGGFEFVEVNGEKRYWGGVIDPPPTDPRIPLLNDFTVFVIKPDGMDLRLDQLVTKLIERTPSRIVAERDFIFDDSAIRKMYPYFFTRQWEADLFAYLKSGISRCILATGNGCHARLFAVRNAVRHSFGVAGAPRIRNLVHCADRQSDAIHQALLFFSLERIVGAVGLGERRKDGSS